MLYRPSSMYYLCCSNLTHPIIGRCYSEIIVYESASWICHSNQYHYTISGNSKYVDIYHAYDFLEFKHNTAMAFNDVKSSMVIPKETLKCFTYKEEL